MNCEVYSHHELLEDIVLDGTSHFLEFGTLLQTSVDVESQDGQHSAVHGHRDRHFVEGDTGEKYLHVLKRADRHTSLTHIAHHAGVVGVITAVCRQVEGYGETFLSGSQVSAVESVRLLSGGESGILTDGPGAEGIHHRVRATQERRNTGCEVEVLHALEVFLGVNRFHLDVLGCFPVIFYAIGFLPLGTVLSFDTGIYIDVFKILSHDFELASD